MMNVIHSILILRNNRGCTRFFRLALNWCRRLGPSLTSSGTQEVALQTFMNGTRAAQFSAKITYLY